MRKKNPGKRAFPLMGQLFNFEESKKLRTINRMKKSIHKINKMKCFFQIENGAMIFYIKLTYFKLKLYSCASESCGLM